LTKNKKYVIINYKDKRGVKAEMLKINFNEEAALQLVTEFIPVKDLLVAAMNEFSKSSSQTAVENSDILFKAVQAYLN
jgi:hypothetical protein